MTRIKNDIELVELKQLSPDDHNARIHDARNLTEIERSLKEFGQHRPFVVQRSTGKIIIGNGMFEAMKKLGYKEALVLWVDDSDERAIRRALADNRTSDLSAFDDAILAELIAKAEGELPGWTQAEIDKIIAQAQGNNGLCDPDEIPPEPLTATARPGDLWILDNHRLICGDSTDTKTVERLLAGAKPHLMVTDPPYGVNYDPLWRKKALGSVGATGAVKNDDISDWSAAWRLFPGDVAYVWHGALHTHIVAASLESCGFKLRSQIIWVKDRLIISRSDYHWQHEACWYVVRDNAPGHYTGGRKQTTTWEDIFPTQAVKNYSETSAHGETVGFFYAPRYALRKGRWKKGAALALELPVNSHWQGGNRQSTTWQISHKDQDCKTIHSTQKPVECMRRPIINNSQEGDAVYEPFAGSGTTVIAAEMEGRKCYAIELDPVYVDVIITRWQNYTGKTAVLDGQGLSFNIVRGKRENEQ